MNQGQPTYESRACEINGLPGFEITGGAGHLHAFHPVAGWRLKANVYLDGTVRLFSGEFGPRFFSPAPFHAGARRARLRFGNDWVAYDLHRLTAVRRLGIGTFEACVRFPTGRLTQRVVLPHLHARELLVSYAWEGGAPPEIWLPLDTPAQVEWYGDIFHCADGLHLCREDGGLRADMAQPLFIRAGYAPERAPVAPPTEGEFAAAEQAIRSFWSARFAKVQTALTGEAQHELLWSLMLMVTTSVWDETRGQLCCTNGGLYTFDHLDPALAQPGGMYSSRDGNQVAFGLVETFPEMARAQILRSFPAFRHDWGLPQTANAIPGGAHVYKTPGSELGGVYSVAFASEQVYWLTLALTEYVRVTGETALWEEQVVNVHGEEKAVRDHLADMWRFAENVVGYGPHGLCRFLSGDWNDYLDDIGSRGRGESFMNCALNILSKERLAAADEARGHSTEAARLRTEAEQLRGRVNVHLRGQWFPRAFDDEGQLVGGEDDRIYADAQSWLALAHCGTSEQRRHALLITTDRCLCPIGLLITDRPLEETERARRTRIPYAPGAGENGGVWWLAGYWLAMALEQEGLATEAERVYDACSMANHHRHFSAEWWSPFMAPDGIDGPASPHYGKAQQPPGFVREKYPNEVAKFAYKLWFATHRGAACRLAD